MAGCADTLGAPVSVVICDGTSTRCPEMERFAVGCLKIGCYTQKTEHVRSLLPMPSRADLAAEIIVIEGVVSTLFQFVVKLPIRVMPDEVP